MMIFI